MATITPIIDHKTFAGSDKGLALPLRRTSAGAFALRISNLDHADPPAPYQPGGVSARGRLQQQRLCSQRRSGDAENFGRVRRDRIRSGRDEAEPAAVAGFASF
jgi:hypothetical protein